MNWLPSYVGLSTNRALRQVTVGLLTRWIVCVEDSDRPVPRFRRDFARLGYAQEGSEAAASIMLASLIINYNLDQRYEL